MIERIVTMICFATMRRDTLGICAFSEEFGAQHDERRLDLELRMLAWKNCSLGRTLAREIAQIPGHGKGRIVAPNSICYETLRSAAILTIIIMYLYGDSANPVAGSDGGAC